jgi:hypothetical protein
MGEVPDVVAFKNPPAPVPGGVWLPYANTWVLGSAMDFGAARPMDGEVVADSEADEGDGEPEGDGAKMDVRDVKSAGAASSTGHCGSARPPAPAAGAASSTGHCGRARPPAPAADTEDAGVIGLSKRARLAVTCTERPMPWHSNVIKIGVDVGGVMLKYRTYPSELVPGAYGGVQDLCELVGRNNVYFLTTVGRINTLAAAISTLDDYGIFSIVPRANIMPSTDDLDKKCNAVNLGIDIVIDDKINVVRLCSQDSSNDMLQRMNLGSQPCNVYCA